jgi:hypothetical protein
MRITVVHGIRQCRGEPAEAVPYYEHEWAKALAACPTLPPATVPFSLRAAYYSHLLIEPGAQGGQLEPDTQAMLDEFLAEPGTYGLASPVRGAHCARLTVPGWPRWQLVSPLERRVPPAKPDHFGTG